MASPAPWQVGINYTINTVVIYDKLFYSCVNAHKSQSDWFPCIDTASLWKQVPADTISAPTAPVVVPVIVQPAVSVPSNTVPSSGAASNSGPSTTVIAPYLYTWGIGNSAYKINTCMDMYNKIKCTAATLAFVIAGTGNQIAQDIYAFTADIKAFIAVGGQPIISFGGADGTYVEAQLSITDMVLQISQLIDTTGCRSLDFDIEGAAIANQSLNDTRAKAIVQLQAKYFGLYVSFTVPADTWGITADGIALMKNAIANGVNISIINAMTMDIQTLPAGKSWGATACFIADVVISQMKQLYPAKSQSELFRMLGICPMIGKNDDSLVFTTDDALIVSAYAKKNNIGLISYWSINRDQTGTGDLGVFSQHNDYDFQYYKNFKSLLLTAVIQPVLVKPIIVPVPVTPVIVVNTPWLNNTKYTVGDTVSQSGANYVYINSHISGLSLEPNITPSLWKKL